MYSIIYINKRNFTLCMILGQWGCCWSGSWSKNAFMNKVFYTYNITTLINMFKMISYTTWRSTTSCHLDKTIRTIFFVKQLYQNRVIVASVRFSNMLRAGALVGVHFKDLPKSFLEVLRKLFFTGLGESNSFQKKLHWEKMKQTIFTLTSS